MATDVTKPLTIYTRSWCEDCHRTLAWLKAHHVHFTEIPLKDNPKAESFVPQSCDGNIVTPVLVLSSGRVLVEPTDQQLMENIKV